LRTAWITQEDTVSKKFLFGQECLVHAYNPSYSGNRSRRITSLRPAWAKVRENLSQKTKFKVKGLGAWLK
jgi:hypothetical protein